MTELKIALDWTPNANHIGFLVSQNMGFYKEEQLDVLFIDPSHDNYSVTPAKKVELGLVDMAMCPLESVISYQTKSQAFDLVAIAALFKEDLSAIVCKNNSGISSPKYLDHTIYGSYNARYEDAIVRQMIKNDGGQGIINCVYPDKLKIWDAMENDDITATWIFTNWESLYRSDTSLNLTYFKLKDYGIPYSYSPVIACSKHATATITSHLKAFLKATKKGFIYAQNNNKHAAKILATYIPEKDQNIDLKQSVKITCDALGDHNKWGIMDIQGINDFLNWLKKNKLEQHDLNATSLFTNDLL
jgi:ABC-type nitrate/sulfonate/bicarbonate transport system substrate-binding protein